MYNFQRVEFGNINFWTEANECFNQMQEIAEREGWHIHYTEGYNDIIEAKRHSMDMLNHLKNESEQL